MLGGRTQIQVGIFDIIHLNVKTLTMEISLILYDNVVMFQLSTLTTLTLAYSSYQTPQK